MKKLLLVFAHPGDESLLTGGTVAKYVHVGWHIELISATGGKNGQTELEKAAATLGISSLTFLDFEEGKLIRQHPGEIEDKVYRLMLAFSPEIVITHEPAGITNDPDHVKLSRSATFAFQKYAKEFELRFPESEQPKLYYSCLPESLVTHLTKQKLFPKEFHGKPIVGTPDKHITTVVNVGGFIRDKVRAVKAHNIQDRSLDRDLLELPADHEYYVLRMQGIKEVFMGKNDRVSNKL